MNWSVVPPILPLLFIGVRITVTITLLSVLTGLVIGTFVGMARLAKSPFLYWPATVYVEFIRGTPLLVQLVLVYYALPQAIGVNLPEMLAGWLAFSINSGAYVSEIVRAGIQSIDRGQTEAARSLGMTFAQAMRYIILPQAFRNIMPALGNEFITLLKDSALMSTIAVPELMRYGQMMVGRTAEPFPIYITVGAIYLALTLPLSLIVRRMERRLGKGDRT